MAITPTSEGVVEWPVDVGKNKTTAPVRWRMAGERGEGTGLLVWVGGLGVKAQDLAAAALRLRQHTGGMTVIGVELPFKDVVCKSNDVASGLTSLVRDAVHQVATEVDPDREPHLGGESRGGRVALEAASHGRVKSVAGLSTMGLANHALGKHPVARGLEAGRRLGRTAKNYGMNVLRDGALRRTTAGGIEEIAGIILSGRTRPAFGYAFDDDGEALVLGHVRAHKARAEQERDTTGFDISLHFPEDDDCFLLAENMAALESIGCEGLAVVIRGRHTCVGSVTADEQLQSVAGWIADTHANQLALASR